MEESRIALSVFGCNQLHGLELPDTNLIKYIPYMVTKLDELIEEFKPDTVCTHYHADTHQDHWATYTAAVAASRKVNNFMMFKPTYPSGRPDVPFHATGFSMLSEDDMKAKAKAIACFGSQIGKYGFESWSASMLATAQGDAWQYAGVHGWAEVFQIGRAMF